MGQALKIADEHLRRLEDLAVTINAEMLNANSLAAQATEKYLAVGRHLLEAREYMPSDQAFGKWRKSELPHVSSNWCSRLMQVASDQRLQLEKPAGDREPLKISVLSEMVSASDEVVNQILAQHNDPEAPDPTVKDVREAKKNAAAPPPAPAPTVATDDGDEVLEGEHIPAESPPKGSAAADSVAQEQRKGKVGGIFAEKDTESVAPSLEEQAQKMVDVTDPFERLAAWDPFSEDELTNDTFIVLGIGSKFTDTAPNRNTLDTVHKAIFGETYETTGDPELKDKLDKLLNFAHLQAKEVREGLD